MWWWVLLFGSITYFSYFGEKYENKLKEILANIDKDICFTKGIVDEVIDEVIDDGANTNDPIFNNEREDRRTKLRYSVHGDIV